MPTLNWIGKDKVVNHHLDVPFRVLEEQYTYGDNADGNMIIHGDNLDALKALLPRFEGRVKCIYIDPPYNTGNEGWVYNDNVNDPKIRKWLGKVVGSEGEDLSRHDKWLCMMYPRLKLLQRLLSDDGFIFVSIDVFEYANLKCIMDEIFGLQNFRNCIAVRRGIKNVQAQFEEVQALSLGHEYIYVYSRQPSANGIHFGEEQTVLPCAMRYSTTNRRQANGAGKRGEQKKKKKTTRTIAQWRQT